MTGQTVGASPTLNMPNNTHGRDWACVSWFNKISNTVANKSCRSLGVAVAALVFVITFIPFTGC